MEFIMKLFKNLFFALTLITCSSINFAFGMQNNLCPDVLRIIFSNVKDTKTLVNLYKTNKRIKEILEQSPISTNINFSYKDLNIRITCKICYYTEVKKYNE